MQNKRDFTKKFIASLIVFMLVFANFATLGNALVVYAADENNQDAINFSAQFVKIENQEENSQVPDSSDIQENQTGDKEQENEFTDVKEINDNPVNENADVQENEEESSENLENEGELDTLDTAENSTDENESEVISSEDEKVSDEGQNENPEIQNQPDQLEESQEEKKIDDSTEIVGSVKQESQEQVLPNGLALEIIVGVNDTGYLKNAKVDIKDLANQIFTLRDDISLGQYIQSIEDNKIKLKQINNGAEVKVYIPIELKSEEYVNMEKLWQGTELVLTTTYVDNQGSEEIFTKQTKPVLEISNDLNLVVGSEIEKFIPYTKDGINEALVQLRVIVGTDTTNLLPIKDTKLNVSIPRIDGAEISDVTVSAITTGFTNGLTNGEAIFTNENWNYQDGIVNISVDNVQKDGIYKRNIGNDEYIISYKYVNLQDNIDEAIKASVEVKSNVFTSKNAKEISNKIEKEYNLSQANSNIVTYELTRKTNEISKGYLYGNSNSEKPEYEIEYDNVLDLNISRVDLLKIVETRESDEYFVDVDGNKHSASGNTYYKSIKVNRENLLSIIGETGNLELLREDGTSLIQINKDTSDDGDGFITVTFGDNRIERILIRVNNPVAEGILNINTIKVMDKLTYGKMDISRFLGIQSEFVTAAELTEGIVTEVGVEAVATEFANTITDPSVSLSRNDLSTLVKNEDVEIEIALNNSRQTSDMYKNPVFELTLPNEVKDFELKDVNLLYGNGELEIGNVETLKDENDNIVLKITLNGTQTKYALGESDKGTTIILKSDITVDMYTASRNTKIEMNYYNEDATNYGLGSDWNMISEPSSYMLNVRQGIYETELNIVAPEGLVNAQMISNYKDDASLISINQGRKEDSIGTFKDARTAEMKMLVINNSNENMSNVSILGRTIFNGNKSIATGEALGTNFDAPMVSKIDAGENAKVYYSENGEATKDLDNKKNGWVEDIDDLSKVKSFLIVVDENVNVGDILVYTYNFEIPGKLTNNIDLAGTFATYYETEDAQRVEEADKVILTTGDAPLLSAEMTSDIKGKAVLEGQYIKYSVSVKNDGRTTAENVVFRADVPEGTAVVNEGIVDEEIFEIEIEMGDIKPYQSDTIQFQLVVKDDYEGNLKLEGIIEADGLEEPIVVSQNEDLVVDVAKILVDLTTEDNIVFLTPGREISYNLTVTGKEVDTIENATISQYIPEGLEFVDAYSVSGDVKGEYNSETRMVTWNIDSIDGTDTFKVTVRAEEIEEYQKVLVAYATVEAENLDAVYNSGEQYSYLSKAEIKINSYTNTDNRYVKEGDTIEYILEVENVGKTTSEMIDITHEIPNGLMIVNGICTKSDGSTIGGYMGEEYSLNVNLRAGEKAEIKLECVATDLDSNGEVLVSSSWKISGENVGSIETEKFENILQPKVEEDIASDTETGAFYIESDTLNDTQTVVGAANTGTTAFINTITDNEVSTSEVQETYRVIGIAFNDRNKNGQRDNNEEGMGDIVAKLCDTTSQKIVCQTVTNSAGEYVFDNVVPGEYYVKFEYDSTKYQVTDYKKEGVNPDRNSDAIVSNYKAVTDKITITDSSVSDIDIGFYRAGIFDLNIDANINRITVQNEDETNTYEMENSKLAKVDINPKYADSSKIFVEYTIDVSNKGEISGYAKSIMSYLPEQLELDTGLNANWYIGTDGNAHTRELENILIQPGETKTITLILTKQMTEEGTGLINNIFEIESDFNEYAISDIDSTPGNKADGEDDMSKADVIIGIQTGGSMINVMLISTTLITLLVVLYVIKLRNDNKNKEVMV